MAHVFPGCKSLGNSQGYPTRESRSWGASPPPPSPPGPPFLWGNFGVAFFFPRWSPPPPSQLEEPKSPPSVPTQQAVRVKVRVTELGTFRSQSVYTIG